LAFAGAVAGISLVALYLVNTLANRYPNSAFATFDKSLKGSS